MHPGKFQHYISILEKILQNLDGPLIGTAKKRRTFIREGIGFSIAIEDIDKIKNELLLKDKWNKKFSEKYLDQALIKIIHNCLKDDSSENLSKYFEILISEFENYSTEHIAIFPVFGIHLELDQEIAIGKINFVNMTSSVYAKIINEIEYIIKNNELYTEEQRKSLYVQVKTDFDSKFKDKVCALYKDNAEGIKTKENGLYELNRSIDLLRLSIPILYNFQDRVFIGGAGDFISGFNNNAILSFEEKTLNTESNILGSLNKYYFNEMNVAHLNKIDFFKISEILKKNSDELNEFESVLISGIHWFSISQHGNNLENQFLNLIICLETILTPRSSDPIQNAVAEGVAFILSREVDTRMKIKSDIKNFYSKRSAITHRGISLIVQTDIIHLQYIVINVILSLIEFVDKFTKLENLYQWIDEQKFS